MAKGRKAIPSKIVDLMGGTHHTHKPSRAEEPKPVVKTPPCPKHLDKLAKAEWRRMVRVLEPIGLLTEADMMIFAAYCEAYSRWVTATMQIQAEGMVVQVPIVDRKTGAIRGHMPKLNPYCRVAHEAYEQMIKAGTQLGLSPSSRATLKIQAPKPKSKAEQFRERLNGTQG